MKREGNWRKPRPLLDRFVETIKLADTPVQTGLVAGTYCWIWQGKIGKGGYGCLYDKGRLFGKGVNIYAHQLSFWLFNGDLVDGLHVDHMCRNSSCVNPNHLRLLTKSQNSDGGWVRPNLAKTHCPHGHEYTPENTHIRILKNGHIGRSCQRCRDTWYQRKLAKHPKMLS